MPLSPNSLRREVHHRSIDMRTFLREDGLYDVEARLVDTKPFPFLRESSPEPIPPGQSLHDLKLRFTVNDDLVVQNIEASSDVTPWPVCKEAENTLSFLVGKQIAKGWSNLVKENLRGSAGCTHLAEMLIPMATTALQGIRGLRVDRGRKMGPDGVPSKIDSCYAYASEREVVKMLWPAHHRTH
jgi:hypothetical protein